MAMSPEQLAAIDRLKNKYNGGNYDPSSNPGGVGNDGHRVVFIPALQDIATAGEATAEQAEAAASAADAARGIALFFSFDDGTSDADPGDGKFRFNHATLSSATMLYIDVETVAETDVTDWIATWDDSNSAVRGELTFISATDAAVWAKFQITGSNTDASGYRKVVLTYVDHAGSFVDGDQFAIGFVRTGNKGDGGPPGNDSTVPGPKGDKGDPASLTFEFSTTTSDADPGAGKFRLNNATVASATQMFIDDAPLEGGSAAAWIATWDDSTNTANRGTITLIDLADRSNWAVFDVTGANTGASGYTKVAVTHVAGNGSFDDEAVFAVEFKRTGNKGADGEDGKDGEGAGNVNPTGSITEDNLASFADGTGNLIEDSGLSKSEVATAVSQAGTAVQPGDLTGYFSKSSDDLDDITEGSTNKHFTSTEKSKLAGIETAADVTDATNVAAAGAFMKASDDLDDISEGTTNKHFTSTLKDKLDGIEASADVTDAGNVASTIHGASGKTTPVDADELGLIDSAASNILKKLTWANVKATLKTYLDTIYQPASSALTALAGAFTPASSSGPAALAFAEDTDNGSNKVTLKAPASVASDIDVTLPSTAGTLAVLSAAQTWTGAQQFGRTAGTIATTSGADFDNASGDDHSRTVAGNVTYTVSNVPSGVRFDMSLLLTYTSGTITWFSGIEWVGGTAPTLTGGKVYEIIFTTFDGGTTWHAAAGEYDD